MRGHYRGRQRWRDLAPGQKAGVIASSGAQFGLAAAEWTDLARRPTAQVRGPKWRWAVLFSLLGDRVEWDRVPFLSVLLLAAWRR